MKHAHLRSAFGATLAGLGMLAPIAVANVLDWNVNDGSYDSATSWTRNPADTNPPDADGIPDSDDNILFQRGGGISYTVTFPGHTVLQPPADYFSSTTAFRSGGVLFVGSTLPLFGPSTYTTLVISMSGSPIGPAILPTSLAPLSAATVDVGSISGSAATLNVNAGTFAVTGSSGSDLLIGDAGT